MPSNAILCDGCNQPVCVACDGAQECQTCQQSFCDDCYNGVPYFGDVKHRIDDAGRCIPRYTEDEQES